MKTLNFAAFLETKSISKENFATKTGEESAELYSDYLTAIAKTMETAIENGATKEELKSLAASQTKAMLERSESVDKIVKEQGKAIKSLLDAKVGASNSETVLSQVSKESKNIETAIKGNKSHDFVVKANFTSASVANSTQAMRLETIGQLATRQLTAYDLFEKVPVGEGSNGVIRYADWDEATSVRAAAMVAEGVQFPESTATFAEYSLSLQKIGDTIPMSEEAIYDIPRFTRELENFLRVNVSIIEDEQLVNGDGTLTNMKGVFTSAGTYIAASSGIVDANIYDLIVKMHEDIVVTGGSKYMPNFALMNIVDVNKMKLKKDGNNNYLVPPFVSADGAVVAGMTIVVNNGVPQNTMVVGDSDYGKIYEVEGYSVSTGYIGNQFTSDLISLKARKRENLLIRTADETGFKKVLDITLALTALS
tara:strand:- start:1145 stop:2413 length:1269 start_codon:yes stop_codon:yes gene_type:complete